MKKNLILYLIFLSVCVSGFSQEKPPEGGEPKDFTVPPSQVFELKNGFVVTLVPYSNLPKVTARLVVRAGNINEKENQVWLADLMGDLIKEGTKTRTAEQIAQEAAAMGGSVNVGVGLDQSTFNGDVLSEYASDLIRLIGDIAMHPSFPASELDRLKKDRIRTLSLQKSQPQSIALAKFRSLLHGNHPYGRIFPTEEMINSYTIDDVKNFYLDNFNATRSHLYISGKFDAKRVRETCEAVFSSWNKGSEAIILPVEAKSSKEIHLIDRPDAQQSTIYMGLPVVDPSHEDYIPLLVTNALLGGSFSSRIVSNIREDKGYTYSPNSSVSSRYRDAYWVQVADVTTNVTGASLSEIFKEIDLLQREAPSAEELKGIQNYMAGIFVLQNSSRSGLIGQLSYINLHELDPKYLETYVKKIYAVTPEDIQRIAKKYIDDDRMTIVIAGDVKKIRNQVKEFGKVNLPLN
ncbi:MAG: insulinase family protein [Calditrichaeota bacterium]|nr:insulinase family protein [Calditrichota bacterium]